MMMIGKLNIPDNMPIENPFISKSVESAQSKIEGMHFDSRKHTLEYDDVLNIQRTRIYEERDDILKRVEEGTLREIIIEKLEKLVRAKEDYLNKIEEVGEENMSQIKESLPYE